MLIKKLRALWRTLFADSAALQDIKSQQRQILALQIESFLGEQLHRNPKYQANQRLNRYEHKVFSQFGEDGIITEIFNRIGVTNKICAEFGVGTGLENNTVNLILQGWRSIWFEGSEEFAEHCQINLAKETKSGLVTIQHRILTVENTQAAFDEAGVPIEFDLLSIDVDGNDFWLWQALSRHRPRVVVIEYNSTFPPPIDWVMPYDPAYSCNSSSYHGASLQAFERLGRDKGYYLVGCCFAGANAFFVREDVMNATAFAAPFTAENHYEPPRFFLQNQWVGHPRRLHP